MSRFLRLNFLTRRWSAMREPIKEGPQALQIDFINSFNYYTFFLAGGIGVLTFYSSFKVGLVRRETFKKNLPVLEKKYG